MNHVQIAVSGIPLRASGMVLHQLGDVREKKRKKEKQYSSDSAAFFLKFFFEISRSAFFEISRSLEVETMESGMTEPSIHEPSEV